MKIYLASRYSRYKEMQGYKTQLETMGHIVTSRWINGSHQISDKGLSSQAEKEKRIQFADEDMKDLNKADLVVCFTEKPRTTKSRGGRHVEMGLAIAWEKKVIVVGYMENVFCCLPSIIFFSSASTLMMYLDVE